MFTPRFVLLLLLLCLFGRDLCASMEPLDQYLGRWVGHYSIRVSTMDEAQILPVEQRYWVEDGQYRGLAIISSDSGMIASESTTYSAGGVFILEVKRGGEAERFFGFLRDSGMLWLSSDSERSNSYEMEDRFVTIDGERVLRTSGFDTRLTDSGPVTFYYEGELVRKGD